VHLVVVIGSISFWEGYKMSFDWQDDVRKFHVRMGLEVAVTPQAPKLATQELRRELVKEEYEELQEAIRANNLAQIADASADLVYVVLGTLVSYGIELRPIWNEVQHANMLKAGGPKREDGKILKPKDWKHPDIQKLIDDQVQGRYHPSGDKDANIRLP
jgi:predicted HAD superfamily Cof-like phosphohydrolase